MSEADKIKWNRKYKEKANNSSLPQPNLLLKEQTPLLSGGKALDLACGLGGNSIYLAQLGFSVHAWDISDVAIHHLQNLSLRHQLSIKAKVKNLDELRSVGHSFDIVVDTFYLNRSLFPLIKHAVKPGGLFLMQTFYQVGSDANTQISDEYKLKPGELKRVFTDWELLYFEESENSGLQSILVRKK